MQHLTVESKQLLIGDEAADALTEYAALVADRGRGDRVSLHALSSDGDEVVVTIVLSSGTTLVVESTHDRFPEPDDAEAVADLRERIRRIRTPPVVRPAEADSWEGQLELD